MQGTKGRAVGGCLSTVNATRPCSHGWGSIGAMLCRLGVAGVAPQVRRHRVAWGCQLARGMSVWFS